ncbi:macro domain-containing protein [Actinacidiphila alni]|uniref:macro domain-containing protein n=1 Tax=Actinacidiphila alni TaxID=380248 RepID=UPI003451417A
MAQFFPDSAPGPGPAAVSVTAGSVAVCVLWGAVRARPVRRVRQEFRRPDMTVTVVAGDLFEQTDAHLVVGFTDTFDTSAAGGLVIHDASVQGQLTARRYDGDPALLDAELALALAPFTPAAREERDRKPLGKLDRYPLGTVAVLGARPRLTFAAAYSRMGNDLVASSGVADLVVSLNRLWDTVGRYARSDTVAMPLVGAGLSRLDFLDRESLLRLILMSFIARSREGAVCRELRLVVRPADLERINMPEVAAFLRTLATGVEGA